MSLVLHVVPVGLSIVGGIRNENKQITTPADRDAIDPVLDPALLDPQGAVPDPVRRALWKATDAHSGIVDLDQLLPGALNRLRGLHEHYGLSAEWESIHWETEQPPVGDQHDGHAYVFVATDTDEGLRTAALVAAGTAGGHPVRYVDEPAKKAFRDARVLPGEVYLCRVPHLDLTKPDRLTEGTWRSLGSIGHVVAHSARIPRGHRWRVVFHLSGGFKALIPYLLVMAEGVNSVCHDRDQTTENYRATVQALVLHENAGGKRAEIPVRFLAGYNYTDLLKLARGEWGEGTNLVGMCLDSEFQLTTMGQIMAAVP